MQTQLYFLLEPNVATAKLWCRSCARCSQMVHAHCRLLSTNRNTRLFVSRIFSSACGMHLSVTPPLLIPVARFHFDRFNFSAIEQLFKFWLVLIL